ncbi:MAG: response regulator transcription factor [Rhizomicrobium sp.]
MIGDPSESARLSAIVSELGHAVTDRATAEIILADRSDPLNVLPAVVLGESDGEPAGSIAANADAEQLDAALRAVAAGLMVRPMRTDEPRFGALEDAETTSLLTPRELDVLVALSEGASNKAVARKLDISQHTVKFHVESIFRKLGVATRAEAVAKGLRRGLVHL